MKGSIKLAAAGRSFPDTGEVTINGFKSLTDIDWPTLGETLKKVKRVEFSNLPFNGCTKIKLGTGMSEGSKVAEYGKVFNYICADWANKIGLKDFIYIKVRK